jgi:hypothetical protein
MSRPGTAEASPRFDQPEQLLNAKDYHMRVVKFSLAACVLSTLFLGVVVANAILAPMPEKAPQTAGWTTTVFKTTF